MLDPGTVVIAYLREPREQIWGVLLKLEAAGLLLRGLDIGSFDDFLKQTGGGEARHIDLSSVFYPITRVEKILFDESTETIPSLQDRFKNRTGMAIHAYLGMRGEDDHVA